jgi:hypothetical protein
MDRYTRAAYLAKIFQANPDVYRTAALALGRQGKRANAVQGLGDAVTDFMASYTDPNAGATAAADNATITAVTNAAVASQPWYETLLNKMADVAPSLLGTVVAVRGQSDCNAINITRAKQGLAPIDCASVVGTNVNVGVSASTLKLLEYGGVALFGLLALMIFKKR